MTTVGCVIPAAGRGERMGGGTPKALRPLAGMSLLEHSTRSIAACRRVDWIVVAAPPEHVGPVSALIDSLELPARVTVVAGADDRTGSVRAAVAALPEDVDIILVHDAARPLVPVEVVDRVVAAVAAGAAAVVPALPVADTIKQVDDSEHVVATVDRGMLRAAQTPQGFAADVLRRVLADGLAAATDDAGLAEHAGVPVLVVAGHEEALKVTRPIDLVFAEAILRRRRVH